MQSMIINTFGGRCQFGLKEFPHLTIFSVLLVSFLILGLALCYRHKLQMASFFNTSDYTRLFIDELDEKAKPFDCFISYCPEDKEATAAIVEVLEKKSPYYTVCTRDRNWAIGSYIPTNIFLSVKKSRKTVMIVSESFLRNKWFYFQFQVAFHKVQEDKDHRLILILKDLPDKTPLPKDVQYYMNTRSCLHWGERWFWERLKYSLENDNIQDRRHRGNLKYMMNCLSNKDESIRELLQDIVI